MGSCLISNTTITLILLKNIIGHLFNARVGHRTNFPLQAKGFSYFLVMFNSLYSKLLSLQILIKDCVATGFCHTVKRHGLKWLCTITSTRPGLALPLLPSDTVRKEMSVGFQVTCHHVNTGAHQLVFLLYSFFLV